MRRIFTVQWIWSFVLVANFCAAQEPERKRIEARAPAGFVVLGSDRDLGDFFVPVALEEERQALQSRIESLQDRAISRQTDRIAIDHELREVEGLLNALEEKIEAKKLPVQLGHTYTQTDVYEFEIGDDKLVAIVADKVIVEGTRENKIVCVVEKSIWGNEAPDDSEFETIRVEHQLDIDSNRFGIPEAEAMAKLERELASEEGKALSEEARSWRRDFTISNVEHRRPYLPFQGKKVNLLRVVGLTWQEGNRQQSYAILDSNNRGSMGSRWTKQAKVTLKVPTCQAVAVLGCLGGVQVQDVDGSVILTTDESRDRDYSAQWGVQGLAGDLTIVNVPVRNIEDVSGSVSIASLDEMRNSGTLHQDNSRTFRPYPVKPTTIREVRGGVTAHYIEADLHIDRVYGSVDILNEFGDTTIELDEDTIKANHRVRSHSGKIRLEGREADLKQASIHAYTQSGIIRVVSLREALSSSSFGLGGTAWQGFVPKRAENAHMELEDFERPKSIWEGKAILPGTSLISRGGLIEIAPTP